MILLYIILFGLIIHFFSLTEQLKKRTTYYKGRGDTDSEIKHSLSQDKQYRKYVGIVILVLIPLMIGYDNFASLKEKELFDSAQIAYNKQEYITSREMLQKYANEYPKGSRLNDVNNMLNEIKKNSLDKERESLLEKQEAFKKWGLALLEASKDMDKDWKLLDGFLDDDNINRVIGNLNILQERMERHKGLTLNGYLAHPPNVLSDTHKRKLQLAITALYKGSSSRIDVIILSKDFLRTGGKPGIRSDIYEAKFKIKDAENEAGNLLAEVRKDLNVNFN